MAWAESKASVKQHDLGRQITGLQCKMQETGLKVPRSLCTRPWAQESP